MLAEAWQYVWLLPTSKITIIGSIVGVRNAASGWDDERASHFWKKSWKSLRAHTHRLCAAAWCHDVGWLQWKKPLVCLCKSTWHEVQMADFFSFSCLVGFLSFFLNSYSTHWLCCSCLLIATSVFVHFHYRTVSTRLTSDLAYIMIPKKELPFWIRYFPRPGK